jgi:uncharacterized membrane protein HdeD (DUF308 family)
VAKTLLIIVGLFSALAGLYALFNPFPATLAATLIAGWSFLILGALEVVAAFRATGWGGRIWAVVLGVLSVVIGVQILGNPLAGVVTLTFAVAILFLATGVAKVVLGIGLKGSEYRWPVLLSGAASVVLGLMILRNFPESGAWALGLLLGVELLSNGIAALALAFSGAVDGRRA